MESVSGPGYSGIYNHSRIAYGPNETISVSCDPSTWINLRGGRSIKFSAELKGSVIYRGTYRKQIKVNGEITGGNKRAAGQTLQYDWAYMKVKSETLIITYLINCSYKYKYYA